eukprot:gb/GECG01003001.1/.p1 GENE.gb/GECG01003001.1/~~gb/GECG01003001.1/.p1  ORF type:complete len:111 (+),score=4.45 gb/GECG01003001.1/:1-333(+)
MRSLFPWHRGVSGVLHAPQQEDAWTIWEGSHRTVSSGSRLLKVGATLIHMWELPTRNHKSRAILGYVDNHNSVQSEELIPAIASGERSRLLYSSRTSLSDVDKSCALFLS